MPQIAIIVHKLLKKNEVWISMATMRGVEFVLIVNITHTASTVRGVNQDIIVLLGCLRLLVMFAKVEDASNLILIKSSYEPSDL